jgi:uncharacterized repeat protein (TIGR03803 family)
MKIFRIPLVIVLIIVAGREFEANAQSETNVHSFVGHPSDGLNPEAGLVQGSDGNFYGTAYEGGTSNLGTVFRISPGGSYTDLYSFVGPPNDGAAPSAGLVQGSDGNLYGTTSQGGTSYAGTVFRISRSGTYTNLYSFGSTANDGLTPLAGLVQGSDGNFYGTTSAGGNYGGGGGSGDGNIFRISPGGNYTNLYLFVGAPTDGASPGAGLVQGSDGNFYGTTSAGGPTSANCPDGCGTVFRISLSGSYTSLYAFVGSPNDADFPVAVLVQGSDGNFYGTTESGGTSNFESRVTNGGTVFRISPGGSETVLYSFVGALIDGYSPEAGLVQGSDGNFYGTAFGGGTNNLGIVFRISPGGGYTNLYTFAGYPNDGSHPVAGLVQGSDGNFYGTTEDGGTNDSGTVFKFSVPLSPPPWPINQITGIQKSSTNIVLTIPSIEGETYQLEYRSSLTSGTWSNVPGVSVTNSIGSILTLTNFAGANQPQGFYRFDITP